LEQYKNIKNAGIGLKISFENLLRILSRDFDEKNYQIGDTEDQEYFKIYSKAYYFLDLGNKIEAIKYSELLRKNKWQKNFSKQFAKYIPLHLELGLRNKGMARLLLQEIQQKDGEHYLDDFFLARIQLLEKDTNGAIESFSRLIENVNRYEAMNRLIFELKFAKEMQASDILLLMNSIKDAPKLKAATIKSNQPLFLNPSNKGIKRLIGNSQSIIQVKKLVKKFANLKDPVMITGETGTGKELVSRAIHEEGPFAQEPFLAINCGSLTESLLQSELFGYVAGAFTGAQKERKGIFEAAGKGTVFLDEFGDISPKMQVSLLRVLESNEIRLIGDTKTRQIECKIVVATNLDLKKAVSEKKFREDLYFRLSRFDILLPPLRERAEDISKLIDHFLTDQGNSNGIQRRLSKELLESLKAYRWPGNIRELKNEMERLKILHSDKEFLNIEDFDFSRLPGAHAPIIKEEKVKEIIKTQASNLKPKIHELSVDDTHIVKVFQRGSKIEVRQRFLKELFQKYKKLTRSQIIEMTFLSPSTVSKDLQNFCNLGITEKRTPTKSVKSHYFVLRE